MAHFGALGFQVFDIAFIGLDLEGDPRGDSNTISLKANDFGRIIGHEPHFLNAQIDQHLRTDPVVPQIGFKSQFLVGFHRVVALFLQSVSLELIQQTDATPLMITHIEQDPFPLPGNLQHGRTELPAGPVTLGTELAVTCPERTPPIYPPLSRRLGETGKVVLSVELDETGRVSAAQVITSSGFNRLDSTILKACGGRVIATNHVARVSADAWRATLGRTAEKCGSPLSALAVIEPDADFPGTPPALKIAVARVEFWDRKAGRMREL